MGHKERGSPDNMQKHRIETLYSVFWDVGTVMRSPE